MDISGLSSRSNQTCLPLGKEKEKFNFHNTNVDAELFTITALTFRGYSFHLEKVPLRGQMAMSAWKAAFCSYLPKSHQYPNLTRLSLRCNSKLLGSRALFLGCGGPKPEAYITSSFSNCSTASCSVNSWVRQHDPGSKLGIYIIVICSSVWKCSPYIHTITYLLLRFKLKPQPYLVSPDETWQSHSHVLCVSPNLLPNFLLLPSSILISTLRCSGKNTYAIHQQEIPSCVLLSTGELCKAFLPAKRKLLAKDKVVFSPWWHHELLPNVPGIWFALKS